MRLLVAITLTLSTAGCAALHHLDDYSFADGPPGPFVLPADGGPGGSSPVAPGDEPTTRCTSHRACTERAALGHAGELLSMATAAVCVKATGTCAPLLTPECPRVVGDPMNDDAVFVGTLLGKADGSLSVIEDAAELAADELRAAQASDGSGRPLVVVGCHAADDVRKAARHLVEELHVAAIVGPVSGEDVVTVTQQVSAKGQTLLVTPCSVSAITNLADEDLTWRVVPSDTQRAKLVIEQINELETLLRTTRMLTNVKLGIVHPRDALGSSARDAISTKLILNGRFIFDVANASSVRNDDYAAGDRAASGAIATMYASTFKPDIVFITSADQITSFVAPLERALTASRAVQRPYYVMTDAGRSEELLSAIDTAVLPADIKRRIRGIGSKPDAASAPVLAELDAAFAARHGSPLPIATHAAAAAAYDAMYAVAYAIAAGTSAGATGATGASVAQGLRKLAVGDPAAVGAQHVTEIVRQLSQQASVSLRGTFGPLQWDASGDLRAGTLEVWCVGTRDGAPAFGTSGLTMDVQTQVVGGSYVQCQ